MDKVNSIVVILLVGAFVLLAFLGIFNPMKINKKGNALFGILMLMWASFWIEEVADLVGFEHNSSSLLIILHGLHIFTGVLIYFSFMAYAKVKFKVRNKPYHLVLPILYLVIYTWRLNQVNDNPVLLFLQIALLQVTLLLYIILSYFILRQHRKQLLRYASNTQGIDLKWLEYIIILVMVTSIFVVVLNVINKNGEPGLLLNGINLIASFSIAYQFMRQKEIYYYRPGHSSDLDYLNEVGNNSERRKLISDNEMNTLKLDLLKLINQKEVHVDPELNLVKLSELMDITPHQLSYVINAGFEQNFFQFINYYRVEKSKKLLQESPQECTILSIAFDSGFNSKTSFNTTFKKLTGKTPTEYRKQTKQ